MTQLEKLKEMLELQMRLNNETNGECWVQGKTKDGREINWYRCIYMECVEAIDSLNWKHWKDINKPDDIENLKVELVDIWHFIMSELIRDTYSSYDYCAYTINSAIFSAERISQDSIMDELEDLLKLSVVMVEIDSIVDKFFNVLQLVLTVDELYQLYIGKNCLNQFRQDNGYKDGTYKKIWNGKEDNVVMMRHIEALGDDLSYDALYNKLSDSYTTAKETK